MSKAQVITIGTEITGGEVVNSNAAWVSRQLEERGLRVYSHISVRDQREEILQALRMTEGADLVIVTGGLGPTSDDITRACMAEFTASPLEFDEPIWQEMTAFYQERGLPLREAHRQQCYFPKDAKRLRNPVGTALGFRQTFQNKTYFVLPGPPRELEGIWELEIAPDLDRLIPTLSPNLQNMHWERWTCLGSPESEIAELVEKAIAGTGVEVGYRAAVPYVKVKIFVDPKRREHQRAVERVSAALAPFTVSTGTNDLADELLQIWPGPVLRVHDSVSENFLAQRLYTARRALKAREIKVPTLEFQLGWVSNGALGVTSHIQNGISIEAQGESFTVTMIAGENFLREMKVLPYKIKLASERGRLSAAEWVLWSCVKALRAT